MREVASLEAIAVLVWAVVQEMVVQVSEAIFNAKVVQDHRVMSLKECKAEALAWKTFLLHWVPLMATRRGYELVKWVAP